MLLYSHSVSTSQDLHFHLQIQLLLPLPRISSYSAIFAFRLRRSFPLHVVLSCRHVFWRWVPGEQGVHEDRGAQVVLGVYGDRYRVFDEPRDRRSHRDMIWQHLLWRQG